MWFNDSLKAFGEWAVSRARAGSVRLFYILNLLVLSWRQLTSRESAGGRNLVPKWRFATASKRDSICTVPARHSTYDLLAVACPTWQVDGAAAAEQPLQRHALPVYLPYVKRSITYAKIPGFHLDQIAPGYEQRLVQLVSELDDGRSGSNASNRTHSCGGRRLGNVYVRAGCVELLLEEEDWGSGSGADLDIEPLSSHLPCSADAEVAMDSQSLGLEGEVAVDALQEPIAVGLSPACGAFGAVATVGEGATETVAWRSEEGGQSHPNASGANRPPGSNKGSDASSGPGYCGSNSGSSSSLDLPAIIRALQLPEERLLDSGSVTIEAEEVASDGAKANELSSGASLDRYDSSYACRSPALAAPDELSRPALEVLALHPRVLLLPPRPAPLRRASQHQPPPQSHPGGTSQPSRGDHSSTHSSGAATGSSAAAAAAATNTTTAASNPAAAPWRPLYPFRRAPPVAAPPRLHAILSCSAPLPSGDVSEASLEVLLRCHGQYLPLRSAWGWQLGDEGGGTGSRHGLGLEAAYAARGLGLAPLPDAATRTDVNRPQLLLVELGELPQRQGIALVDFRWLGRPCRAVPLVLTRDPAVAAELGAAVAAWPRSPAELDELLLDFGTWEFHAARADEEAAEAGAAADAPLDSVCTARVAALGTHLLLYVTACGWTHTAAHVSKDLSSLSASAAAVTAAAAGNVGGGEAGGVPPAGVADPPPQAPPPPATDAAPSPRRPSPVAHAAAAAACTAPEMASGAVADPTAASGSSGGRCGGVSSDGAVPAAVESAQGCGGEVCDGLRKDQCGRGPMSSSRVAWTLVLLALGLRRETPAEEAAFKEFSEPWIFAHGRVLMLLDLMCLVTLLFRARSDILASSNLTTLVACFGGVCTILARPFLSYSSWVRLVNGYRLPRLVSYSATKALIAFCGVPAPPGIQAYFTGPGLLVMEGIIVPGASMLPPAVAAVALSLLCSLTYGMLVKCGVSRGTAAAVGLRTLALGAATTVASRAYMRACFWRRRQRQQRQRRQGACSYSAGNAKKHE